MLKMENQPNVTIFIPSQEEKDRLLNVADEVIRLICSHTKLDYEVSFVLKEIVEGFQIAHKCVIPIEPNKIHLLIKSK